MALNFPDIVKHNNILNAVVDSDSICGSTISSVDTLGYLYGLGLDDINAATTPYLGKFKEYATRVYVKNEAKFYILKDFANRGNANGWQAEDGSSAGNFYPLDSNPSGYITGIENIVYTTGDQSISGDKNFLGSISISGQKVVLTDGNTLTLYQVSEAQFNPINADPNGIYFIN